MPLYLLAGVATVAGGAAAARHWLSPFRALPAEGLRLFVGHCPYSQSAFLSVRDQPAVRERLTPVPILDPRSEPMAREVCSLALASAARAHPWVDWLPAGLACRWMAEDAAAFHQKHFVHLPAFSLGDRPVAPREQARVLRTRGLEMAGSGEEVHIVLAGAAAAAAARPATAGARAPSVDIVNQPIGW